MTGPSPPGRNFFRRGPERPPRRPPRESASDRWALWLLLVVHLALEAALAVAGWTFFKSLPALPLSPAQKAMFEVGLVGAFLVFGLRGALLLRRLRRRPPRPAP